MITNLFSVFDPSANFNLPINWLRTFLAFIFIAPFYWATPTKNSFIIKILLNKLFIEFKILLSHKSKPMTVIFLTIFIFILINNFLGLFPYIFTTSSHLVITLAIRLPLWISLIFYGWINHTNHIFAHLVPNRTPAPLIPFIVLIESIRNVIRPLTLAVRLIANIVAGHLLITLLGNQTAIARNFILIRLVLVQILLLTLERAVAIIQSYVFAVLSTLYTREI